MKLETKSKLYLQGEYSILTPGHKAILLSINKKTYANIYFSKYYEIYTDIYSKKIKFNSKDKRYTYILGISKLTINYLQELGIKVRPFSIDIYSELFNKKRKLGLGSSASVLVLIVKSILSLFKVKIDKLELFKLCTIISVKLNEIGSMGDIACIVNDKHTVYTSYDFSINKEIKKLKISDAIKMEFKYLKIEDIDLDYSFYIFNTGISVKTKNMIKNIHKLQKDKKYIEIISSINELVIDSIENKENILPNMLKNNKLLEKLSKIANICIINEEIDKYLTYLYKHNFFAKISGAGGGDNILLASKEKDFNFNMEGIEKI